MSNYVGALELPPGHPMRSQAERLITMFDTHTFQKDGVIYWKSNGNIPPEDVLQLWNAVGKRFNYEKSVRTLRQETEKFLRDYARRQRRASQEQLAEMRAAFGPGVEVVDVFTGRRYRT